MVAEGKFQDPMLGRGVSLAGEFVGRDGFNIRRLCEVLGLRAVDLAELVGRDTPSVSRYLQREGFVRPDHERTVTVLRELTQVIGLLRAMKRDDEAATWLHVPLPSYGGATALQVIARGEGQDLIQQLLALAVGDVG